MKTFSCPHCQAKNDWADYCEGKQVTCPGCRQRFVAILPMPEETTEITPYQPIEQPEEIPYVLPVTNDVLPIRESPRRRRNSASSVGGGPLLDCTQEIRDVCERRDLQHLPPIRRLVYALLVAALETLRPHFLFSLLSLMLFPFILGFALCLGFGLMLAVYILCLSLETVGLGSAYGLLYLMPAFVILIALYSKKGAKVEPITLARNDAGKVERLKLGRLDSIFRISEPATTLFFFSVLLSSQVGLLYFLPDHLGVAEEGTFLECTFLTLDNLGHGVLLDTQEIYNIHFANKIEHNFWTGTVFYGFRLGYEASLLLAAYQLWRHYSMRRLFRHVPRHWRNIEFVTEWIDLAMRTEGDMAREFLDEFLFLVLVGAFLTGNDAMLRDVNHRFPWLRIDEEVRKLFVDSHGHRLFERAPEPDS